MQKPENIYQWWKKDRNINGILSAGYVSCMAWRQSIMCHLFCQRFSVQNNKPAANKVNFLIALNSWEVPLLSMLFWPWAVSCVSCLTDISCENNPQTSPDFCKWWQQLSLLLEWVCSLIQLTLVCFHHHQKYLIPTHKRTTNRDHAKTFFFFYPTKRNE